MFEREDCLEFSECQDVQVWLWLMMVLVLWAMASERCSLVVQSSSQFGEDEYRLAEIHRV